MCALLDGQGLIIDPPTGGPTCCAASQGVGAAAGREMDQMLDIHIFGVLRYVVMERMEATLADIIQLALVCGTCPGACGRLSQQSGHRPVCENANFARHCTVDAAMATAQYSASPPHHASPPNTAVCVGGGGSNEATLPLTLNNTDLRISPGHL